MADKTQVTDGFDAKANIINLVKLDNDIHNLIANHFNAGNVSIVSIIGVLEKHKIAVVNAMDRFSAINKAKGRKAKNLGALAK